MHRGIFPVAAITGALLVTALACAKPSYAAEVKVAFLPCGTINDKSWSEAGYVGVVAAMPGAHFRNGVKK